MRSWRRGETGKKIHEKTGLEVKPMLAGPQGGDLQIGAFIASQNVDVVIFPRDPLTAQPHEPDISALLRVCDVHNIPLATNLASAEILINAIQNTLAVDNDPRSRAERAALGTIKPEKPGLVRLHLEGFFNRN